MSKVTYKVTKHEGGWAYEVNGTFSERFRTRDAARKAARLAACEQVTQGESAAISHEDDKGRGEQEMADGRDRPKTTVEG
jgi:hypothetical protein